MQQFPRYTESYLRQLLELYPLPGPPPDPQELAKRLRHLERNLAPELEFSLILSWLGKCDIVHRHGQEQLPWQSTDEFRVPDLLAVFNHEGKSVPVLIEVKKTGAVKKTELQSLEKKKLKRLSPGYLRYAEALGLPMLVAWKFLSTWSLFEMRHATLAETNFKIDLSRAMAENLLDVLAGDFTFRVVPGTAIRMRIEKLSEPDANGSYEGKITDIHLANASGERVPNIPFIQLLFHFMHNEAEVVDEGDAFVQSFVIQDTGISEKASHSLGPIVHSFAALRNEKVDWRSITHNKEHWVHRREFSKTIRTASEFGVIDRVYRLRPKHPPAFL